MDVDKISVAELIFDSKSVLGEGAFWNYQENKLWWVDIEGKKLNIYDPESGKNREIDVGQRIGTVVPSNQGGAVVALQNGIFHLDLQSENLSLITNPLNGIPNTRFNDGKCDPSGRFWVGTMELNSKEGAASLYRMDPEGNIKEMVQDLTISNGITWAKDKKAMFFIDTPSSTVVSYSFDDDSGEISNKKVVIRVPEEMGHPDGMTIDADDKLWIAHYGGFGVYRWDPYSGELMEKVQLPVPNVTSCAFGGENLDQLFITTANQGMDEEKLKRYPLSGGLFKATPGVKGVRSDFFNDRRSE